MNKLPTSKRAQIIGMLVEGMSMRAIARITGVSINTVVKLLADAGNACADFHNEAVRGVTAKRIQADEIWSFVYAKQKHVPSAKAAPEGAGDVWTWTALDADSKLLVSYTVGDRSGATAFELMSDLRQRLAHRVQLTTDGHRAYLEAVEGNFGADIDYAMLIKLYGQPTGVDSERRYSPAECIGTDVQRVQGHPDPAHISTSYAERQNLSMRMGMRRFTRLTNAFSKKVEKHAAMVNLYVVHYNFCRLHKSLKITPAMAAGLDDTARDCEWIVSLIDAATPEPQKPGPRRGTRYAKREKSN